MRFFFAVLTEAIQIFFSSVHLPSVCVSLQYPLSMRIHDYRFPESASFERKEQGVREEGKSKIDKSLSKLVDFGAKKNTNHPKRVIGIFGGGRWIRTIEAKRNRFTVCPLWPLGNSPIFRMLCCGKMELVDGFEPPTC